MYALDYTPVRVCPRSIHVEVSDDGSTIHNVAFDGGCNGNTKGISALVEGMPVDEVIKRLEGITCGFKNTSCPAQLAEALKENAA